MMRLKKIISLMLIVAMLSSVFLACGKSDDGPSENNATTDGHTSEVPEETLPAELPVEFPEISFNGRDFNVATRDSERVYDQFDAEMQNAEPFNDALYKRNEAIEERYGIKINQISRPEPTDDARKNILAGTCQYDLIVDYIYKVNSLATQKHLSDLYTVPYIKEDLDKSWWDQALIRDLAINGKLFFQTGDIVVRDKMRVAVMYFNKDMFKSLNLEYPYKYVLDGTWTIDRLVELTKGVNSDLNGDDVMDQYDQWGLMSQHENGLHMFLSSGETMIKLNKDGIPEITMNTPRAIEVIEKVLRVSTDGTTMFHADTIKGADNIWTQASAYFQENRFLIRTSVFEPIVRDLRAMETDFGILPYVKYDEQQTDYYTPAESSGFVVGIPVTADLEYSGLITESLAYESKTTLMPAFYDLCLTSKILRDNESEGMLDIIFNNRVYDMGYIYSIGVLPSMLRDLVSAKNLNFTSRFDAVQNAVQNALDKFLLSYE